MPPAQVSDSLLMQFNEVIANRTGLNFTQDRLPDLKRGLTSAALESGQGDVNSFIRRLMDGPLTRRQIEILAGHLTVGETYFFRDPGSFEAIRKHVLAAMVHDRRWKKRNLRIWTAGCATGEEAYTMAILLHELVPDIDSWRINILATDINPRFLQHAANGLYSDWSFRGVPESIRETYFDAAPGGRYRIIPRIKRMVNFAYHNLAEDNYPALTNGTNAMDLIICRNVLMYFNPVKAAEMIENIQRCLVSGGWLVVSAVEASISPFPGFTATNLDGATFYRKLDGPAALHPDNSLIIRDTITEKQFDLIAQVDSFREADSMRNVHELPPMETVPPATTATAVIDPYEQAESLYMSGQYGPAEEIISRLLSEKPEELHAIKLLARILANQGRLDEAMDCCRKSIDVDRLDAGCHYLLATIQHELGLIEDTVISLKRALYLDPELVLAYFTLGNIARIQGKTREQVKYLANALELLNRYRPEDTLPESEGMTAARLREILQSLVPPREAA